MQNSLAAIVSTIIGMAGWFYLFQSRAAHKLATIEQQRINVHRIRMRRAGGVVMLVLALTIYLGMVGLDPDTQPRRFVADWLAVFILLMSMVILAMIDLRLTLKLRRPKDINPP